MGNTVGSRRGQLSSGLALRAYKSKLNLTSRQISILIGSLLGDGTLRVGYKAANANFKIEQGLVQKGYCLWKYDNFKEWVLTPPKLSYRYHDNGERYEKSWWFRTVRHPKITFFRNLFYNKQGRKIIPKNIGQFLDPLSFAVWIMDDGYLSKKGIYDISTYSFKENEIHILQRALMDKFQITGKYFSDRDKGFRMYFPKSETKNISSIISPHIVSCMKYKLPLLTP